MKATRVLLVMALLIAQSQLASDCSISALAAAGDKAQPKAKVEEHTSHFNQYITVLDKHQLSQADFAKLKEDVQRYPKEPEGAYALGLYEQRAGYLDLAADEFEKSWRMNKSYGDPLVLWAGLKFRLGQRSDAERIGELALTNVNDSGVLYRLAAVMDSAHSLDMAERLYKRVLELAPGRYEHLNFAISNTMLKRAEFQSASDYADAAIKQHPDCLALAAKAKAMIGLRRYNDALTCFQKAVNLDPRDANIDGDMRVLAMYSNHPDKALEPALYLISLTIGDKVASDKAKADVIALLQDLPYNNSKVVMNTVGDRLKQYKMDAGYQFAVGDCLDRTGHHEDALVHYRLGLQSDAKFARAHMRIGKDIELYHRDLFAARDNYKKAYDLDPADKEISARYARALYQIENRHNDVAQRLKDWLMASGGSVKSN